MPSRPTYASGIFLSSLLAISGLAQEHPDSPVFKEYRVEKRPVILERSSITARLWHLFMLERKANGGDVLAQHELGLRYLTGSDVVADTMKGAYWISRAASQELIPAKFNLGILLYHGWGFEWNPFQAFQLFRETAVKGMMESQLLMGQLLTEDLVVPRDWHEAHRWVKLAADSGYAPAREALPRLEKYLSLIREGKSGDSMEVVRFVELPSFLGMTDTSSGIGEEWLMAREILREASPEVRKALGLSAATKSGMVPSDSMSIETLERVAAAGVPEVLIVLGRVYERGIRVERDIVRAASFYIRALRQDAPAASELLLQLGGNETFFKELVVRAPAGDAEAAYVWAACRALGFDAFLLHGKAWLPDSQAVRLLRTASLRHIPSMIELGIWHYGGKFVALSEGATRELWTRAAKSGSSEAGIRLAALQTRRDGGSIDTARIVGELYEGVRLGSLLAQVALAYCFEQGLGVPQRTGKAVEMYRSAAERGSRDAYRALRRLHDAIRPDDEEFRVDTRLP